MSVVLIVKFLCPFIVCSLLDSAVAKCVAGQFFGEGLLRSAIAAGIGAHLGQAAQIAAAEANYTLQTSIGAYNCGALNFDVVKRARNACALNIYNIF